MNAPFQNPLSNLYSTCARVIPFISLFSLLLTSSVVAQTDIYVRKAQRLFPVALPQLCIQSTSTGADIEIPKVLARDLEISGVFQVIDRAAYIEAPGKCTPENGFAFSDWSVIGAEGLVKGVITGTPSGIKVQMYLYDVQKQQMVMGKEYEGAEALAPKIAHRFANEIMKYFTGEAGIFGSQIAFSSRIGRFKELFVMDMSGGDLRQITDERSLAISHSWDRAGNGLIYTSYRKRVPDLFLVNLLTKKTVQLTKNSHLELGARFSHDGSKLIASVTEDRDSDIVLLNDKGIPVQRLTPQNGAIDVSPDWSPDDSKIVFCSNRGGGPQIYVMNADGSQPHRISFVSSNYCTSPRWSPKGDKIVFVCRSDGGFQIYVTSPDGTDPLQLTSLRDNEDPEWSPDGRYLAFGTTNTRSGASQIAIMKADGTGMKTISSGRNGDFQPSWGPLDK